MNKKAKYIAVPGRFFALTLVGMIASMVSGICISDASLTVMQYFMHYGMMFVGSVCFVKAIGMVHAYEKRED